MDSGKQSTLTPGVMCNSTESYHLIEKLKYHRLYQGDSIELICYILVSFLRNIF